MENLAPELYIRVCCKWGLTEAHTCPGLHLLLQGDSALGTGCCDSLGRPVSTCPGCCCCTLAAAAPPCRPLGHRGRAAVGWSSMLPSQITAWTAVFLQGFGEEHVSWGFCRCGCWAGLTVSQNTPTGPSLSQLLSWISSTVWIHV